MVAAASFQAGKTITWQKAGLFFASQARFHMSSIRRDILKLNGFMHIESLDL
jgi:hypothetical protein